MADVDFNGDGVMDMETDGLAQLATSVSNVTAGLETTLRAHDAEIASLVAGLFRGPMGRAAGETYRASAEECDRRATWMLGEGAHQGRVASLSVDNYLAYDQTSTQAIDSV